MTAASIRHILKSKESQVAPGLYVDRPLPQGDVSHWDPFLLLDHFGPTTLPEGKENTIAAHPHRGFEPVTFLFSGKAVHKDSLGNRAEIKSGGVQWITAGSGLVHEESITYDEGDQARTLNGIQLWVNLPIRHKMTKPKYQVFQNEEIPVIDKDPYLLRLVSGEILDHSGPAITFSPIIAAHIIFQGPGKVQLPVDPKYNTMIYMVKQTASIANREIPRKSAVLVEHDGDHVEIEAKQGTELLFLSGQPLNEPVASYGPFVMNNMRQIYDAIDDYQSGKMGTITS